MQTRTGLLAFVLAVMLCGGTLTGWTQDSAAARPPEKQPVAYRLDFSVNELEDGKKINTRHYSMNMTDEHPADLKIETRVPVPVGMEQGKMSQYVAVGTSIHARLEARPNSLSLYASAEISSFAVTDQAARAGGQALIRQMNIVGGTLIVSDKPVVIASVDDPNSTHQFQLEVATTRIR